MLDNRFKQYSVSIGSKEFTNYMIAYNNVCNHWCECGGKLGNPHNSHKVLVWDLLGNKSVVAAFLLTFDDDNLIVRFTEKTESSLKFL